MVSLLRRPPKGRKGRFPKGKTIHAVLGTTVQCTYAKVFKAGSDPQCEKQLDPDQQNMNADPQPKKNSMNPGMVFSFNFILIKAANFDLETTLQ